MRHHDIKQTQNITRRTLLKSMGIGAGISAFTVIPGCKPLTEDSASSQAPALPGVIGKDGRPVLPWKNWSGNQSSQPSLRYVPKHEEQLRDIIVNSTQTIRCVGAGHSFSPLVPTPDTLLSLARFRGINHIDHDTKRVDVGAGTLLSQLGEPLWDEGLGLINMPDIDTQALAGAIATSTHGTGATLGSMSSNVTEVRLMNANGDIIECSATQNSDVFHAARNNIGALGVVTQIQMQARSKYKLVEKSWVIPLRDALEQAEALRDGNRHFEMYAFPHADYALMLTINEVDINADNVPLKASEDSSESFRTAADWTERLPFLRSFIMNRGLQAVQPDERTDRSYRIFGNLRDILFNEMEYSVPADVGPACLKEILSTIKRHNIDVVFPIEYRYIKQDDVWLSPFYQRDSCAISCHNFHDKDYKTYFSAIEPIFHKYDGRPHWGKINALSTKEFNARYEKFGDFLKVRDALDPTGKFANSYIKRVLGVS